MLEFVHVLFWIMFRLLQIRHRFCRDNSHVTLHLQILQASLGNQRLKTMIGHGANWNGRPQRVMVVLPSPVTLLSARTSSQPNGWSTVTPRVPSQSSRCRIWQKARPTSSVWKLSTRLGRANHQTPVTTSLLRLNSVSSLWIMDILLCSLSCN